MNAKFTPGPWITGKPEMGDYGTEWSVSVYAQNAPRGQKLPTVCYASSRETAEANARLIAAAPELLEACNLALNVLVLLDEEVKRLKFNADKVPAKIRAAIFKATGQ